MARENIPWESLRGETVYFTRYGNAEVSGVNHYGVMTLVCKSGREFVVTQCAGEVQLSEVVKK